MLFSSAMEEASGKHYEVRFSTTQRWAVASIVLLVLTAVYLACEAAVFVLSALAPEPSGIMWGGELVSGEVLRPLRLVVVVTLCCGLEVCQVMVRSRLLWERGEKDEALVVTRRHRNVGLALVALGARSWRPTSRWRQRLPGGIRQPDKGDRVVCHEKHDKRPCHLCQVRQAPAPSGDG